MYGFFTRPAAIAYIRGGSKTPDLYGKVSFYQERDSVLIIAKIENLPKSDTGFFAFHIHEGNSCSGEAFSSTGNHYNPKEEAHPKHAGDLPPLMLCNGGAYLATKTERFCVKDIIGRTVVIHSGPDDFKTQPGGGAGEKIACGVILKG